MFPRPNDEFGEWTESEKQAIRAYHLQRDVALNQWVITGKAVEVFKTIAARRTTYGKKAKVHSIPQQYKKAARLWPTFKAEKKKDRRRAHFRGFRAWLQKRSHPILLDEHFEKWWASHTRQLSRLSK